jgi:hypothetical protein
MSISTVETTTIDLVETIKNYKGFNYAAIESVKHNNIFNTIHFECNCSAFDTEEEVLNFIREIA